MFFIPIKCINDSASRLGINQIAICNHCGFQLLKRSSVSIKLNNGRCVMMILCSGNLTSISPFVFSKVKHIGLRCCHDNIRNAVNNVKSLSYIAIAYLLARKNEVCVVCNWIHDKTSLANGNDGCNFSNCAIS
jgi:hypothetical protein